MIIQFSGSLREKCISSLLLTHSQDAPSSHGNHGMLSCGVGDGRGRSGTSAVMPGVISRQDVCHGRSKWEMLWGHWWWAVFGQWSLITVPAGLCAPAVPCRVCVSTDGMSKVLAIFSLYSAFSRILPSDTLEYSAVCYYECLH